MRRGARTQRRAARSQARTARAVRLDPRRLALALTSWANAAAAQDDEADQPAPSSPVDRLAQVGLAIGAKVVAGLGKPASEFGATPVFELELQYLLPLDAPIGRSLAVFFSGQYTQPGIEGETAGADPRLPGAAARASISRSAISRSRSAARSAFAPK